MRGRWWVWLCWNCGGVTAPSSSDVRCLRCRRTASDIYRPAAMAPIPAMFWACHECGGEDVPPEHDAKCVNCGRTLNEVATDVLARSGLRHQEYVSFPNADPS